MYIKIESIAGKRGIIPCYINISQFTNINIYSSADALRLSAENNKESFKKVKTSFAKQGKSMGPLGNSSVYIHSTTPIDWVQNSIAKQESNPPQNKFLSLPLIFSNQSVDETLINMECPLLFQEYIFTEEDRKNDVIERKECKTYVRYEDHWIASTLSPDEIFDMLNEVKSNAS